MLLRTRLVFSMALIVAITVVTALAGYIAFRSTNEHFHSLTEDMMAANNALVEVFSNARDLADAPIAYALAESESLRVDALAEYDQATRQIVVALEQYHAVFDNVHASDELDVILARFLEMGRQLISQVDAGADGDASAALRSQLEHEESLFTDLILDTFAVSTEQLTHGLVDQGQGVVAWGTIASIAAALLAGGGILYVLLKAINKPLRQLTRSAAAMVAGDYAQHIEVTRKDEIGELATAFNAMARAVESRERSMQQLNESLEAQVEERTRGFRRAMEQAEVFFTHSTDTVIVLNLDHTVANVNPAFVELFGYSHVEAVGLSMEQLVVKQSREPLANLLSQVLVDGQVRMELYGLRQDGTWFIADTTFGLIEMDPESPQQIMCNLHDVTRQKVIQEELQEALRKERELGALKSRFVAMVSHEFRTPLAVIQSSSDMMKHYWDRLDQERRIEKLDEIQAQVHHMTGLLADFLSIGQTDITGIEFLPEPVDVTQFCLDLIEEMKQIFGSDRIRFSTQGTPTKPLLDPSLLRQIMVNLLTNGLKYSPSMSPVEVELIYADDGITIHVRDQGIGIPVEDRPHVYEAFHRGINIGNIPGTGLGLAIIKRAVKAHHGDILFQSEVGKGTIFTVVLPARSV